MDDSELPPIPAAELLRKGTLFYLLLFGAALLWTALAGRPLRYGPPLEPGGEATIAYGLGLGLVAGALVIALSHALTQQTEWGARLAQWLGALLGPLTPLQCLWLALLSGVAEEAFFRGALQPAIGWVAASLVFGLAHWTPRRELLPWTLFATAAGFLFGALFERGGGLLAPTAAHVLVNAVNLVRLTRRSRVAAE